MHLLVPGVGACRAVVDDEHVVGSQIVGYHLDGLSMGLAQEVCIGDSHAAFFLSRGLDGVAIQFEVRAAEGDLVRQILLMAVGERTFDDNLLTAAHPEGDVVKVQLVQREEALQVLWQLIVCVLLRVASHHLQGLEGVALAEGAIAGGGEMPGIDAVARDTLCTHHVRGRYRGRHLRHYGIMGRAATTHLSIFRLTHEQGHVLSVQTEVRQHILVDTLYHLGPVGITVVRTTLMQQDALDDTCLLRLLAHVHQSLVGVAAVGPDTFCLPAIGLGQNTSDLVRHKTFDGDTADGYIHDAHLDITGQGCYHGTSEIVGHAQSAPWADNGAVRRIPVAQGSFGTAEITRSKHLETLVHFVVHILPPGIALHVPLSQTKIHIEIGVGLGRSLLWLGQHGQSQQSDGKYVLLHNGCKGTNNSFEK